MNNFPLNKDEYIALEITKTILKDICHARIKNVERTEAFINCYLEVLEDVKKAQHKEPKARSL
ncbi:hypothetical protein Q6A90_04900 [Aliarcobacter skirrowii]|uniref:hypothetical protein n=1 Tax=Aliarcobacter skirrowii TaxID=28200 RepID=UPI0029AB6E3F|nr:hypothetical protein [Aliarcobacter skirrowii]MDX4061700.1 hypothetical protein [Aliarcobacter skirrowii]